MSYGDKFCFPVVISLPPFQTEPEPKIFENFIKDKQKIAYFEVCMYM